MNRGSDGFVLRECLVKFALIAITVAIGLWCGINDSFNAFYIAALIQAINNAYDSFGYLTGYGSLITFFQMVIFLLAIAVFIISVIHFTKGGNIMDNSRCVIFVTASLTAPILFFGVESVVLICQGRY